MFSYDIGLRGMQIAQRAIELVGTNMSNASTEGYHAQTLVVNPLDFDHQFNTMPGTAEMGQARREIDNLLEQEITRQKPIAAQTSQELETLQTVESALGDINSNGLSTALGDFFNSLQELASQPTSQPLMEQTIGAANNLVSRFHDLSLFIQDLTQNVDVQAKATATQANNLMSEVGQLNKEIGQMQATGGNINLLSDRRDQAISELATLVDAEPNRTVSPDGMVSVSGWGTPLVINANATQIEAGRGIGGKLGVSVKGAGYFQTDVRGGKLGGLLSLANDILPKLQDTLDTLSRQVITQVNQLHVQGTGLDGSFGELQGQPVGNEPVGQWKLPVTDGTFYVRTIDTATGQATRTAVDIDADTDTVDTVVGKLNAIPNLSASYAGGLLRIAAQDGYNFDFVPALSAQPSASSLNGTADVTISGQYTGTTNQTYTARIINGGTVGVTAGMKVELSDDRGNVIKTVTVGQGYAAGDLLDVGDGIHFALGTGDLWAGDTFDIQALADSDTSGFLSAAGMNTLFTGDSALSIGVRRELFDNPSLLASSSSAAGGDNFNVARMANLAQEQLQGLGNTTMQDYFRQMVSGVGQDVATRDSRQKALDSVQQQLSNQRDGVSGVDINEEAAKLLTFQRMFQAMSKFISTQDQSMQYLMETL